MKILNWMQSKLNGRQGTNKPSGGGSTINHILHEPRKDEFSDWPNGLLAIGTFGNNDLKEDSQKCDPQENPSSSEDQLDFTPEEVGKLQKELTKLLSRKPIDESEFETSDQNEVYNLPLDKFLNCPSTLEVDRTNCNKFVDDSDDKDINIDIVGHSSGSNSVVLNKGKEVCMDGNNNAMINKKSISFLLKKVFMCRSGFAPSPSLRDQIPESRMEKLLRAILTKKINPQSSTATSKKKKKYLENRHNLKMDKEDETEEKEINGCKWVKTDSEYIVLEI